MSLGILIEDEASRSNWELAEADMRRFWSHRCKVHRYPDKIFIEVGSPVRIRVKMGVDRLKSFCVQARPAISWSLLGKHNMLIRLPHTNDETYQMLREDDA